MSVLTAYSLLRTAMTKADYQRPLSAQTKNRLERHREDYAAVTGHPFEHFFCPLLFEDSPTEVIRGHVINEAFKGSPRAWIIQRKDG